MSTREKYPLKWWRPIFDILLCYFLIFFAIRLSFYSMYFYPVSVLILANRILALSLISHEAIHGSLFNNYQLNNFVGRWFCAFPTCISLSKYRKLHLLHHRALGNNNYDPDYVLYKSYPQSGSEYLKQNIYDVITLKTVAKFIDYYTELNEFFLSKENLAVRIKKNRINGDLIGFLTFYLVLIAALIYTNTWTYYIIFFCVPLVFITQPYVLLMGGLQHGPMKQSKDLLQLSRSVRGPKFFMEIVLPLDINYHSEHHYNASVPHYWLKRFSADLVQSGNQIWSSTYPQAIDQLFGPKKS